MSEKDLRPVEQDLINALRAHEAHGRGEIHVFITPEHTDIQEGKRRRHVRVKKMS